LWVFDAAETPGDLRTVFTAKAVPSVTDRAVVVVDLPASVRITILRIGKEREKKKTENQTQADSFQAAHRSG
jgi:hypothetical protein